ncbi:MAG: hypothetical protein U9P79_02790 [Candidatus Cloacimonadota bacterium]|nr:hypothetical protein [Candidatus Cloacimonadota bacterium]
MENGKRRREMRILPCEWSCFNDLRNGKKVSQKCTNKNKNGEKGNGKRENGKRRREILNYELLIVNCEKTTINTRKKIAYPFTDKYKIGQIILRHLWRFGVKYP